MEFVLFWIHSDVWFCRCISFDRFGKFSANISSALPFLFSFWDSDNTSVRSLIIVLLLPETVHYFSVSSFCLEWILFWCFIFQFTDLSSVPPLWFESTHWVFFFILTIVFFHSKISIWFFLCLLFLCWDFSFLNFHAHNCLLEYFYNSFKNFLPWLM